MILVNSVRKKYTIVFIIRRIRSSEIMSQKKKILTRNIRLHVFRYLDDGAGLREDVVNGVTRDPDHRGEGHQEPQDLCPAGVHVVVTIGDGAVGDAVEDEHREHHEGGEVFPAEIPEHVGPDASHLLHAVTEPLRAKHPPDGDGLEETDPE